jgi:hypothetical protein
MLCCCYSFFKQIEENQYVPEGHNRLDRTVASTPPCGGGKLGSIPSLDILFHFLCEQISIALASGFLLHQSLRLDNGVCACGV